MYLAVYCNFCWSVCGCVISDLKSFSIDVVLNVRDVLFSQLCLHFMVQVFWDVQLYILVNSYRHCRRAYCFHLQDKAFSVSLTCDHRHGIAK
jgi:hypothetical protein